MKRLACLTLLALPVCAQAQFRATRHAGLPFYQVDANMVAGDVDGDGDVDLVTGVASRSLWLLLNDGRGRFTNATAGRLRAPASAWPQSADLADLDGDGDLDLLLGNDLTGQSRVHVNDGTGVFTDVTATTLPPTVAFVQDQVVADFDGDGDVDWLTVEGTSCRFYRNQGNVVFVDASAVALRAIPVVYGDPWEPTARAADVDGDGDLDAMVPTGLGPQLLLVNQAGVLSPHPSQPAGRLQDCVFVDVDGDGDPDIVARGNGRVMQNQGNGTFVDVTTTAFVTPPLSQQVYAVFDADDDGDADLVSWQTIWVNDGLGVFAAVASQSPYLGVGVGGAVADFDGDGDIDLPGTPNFLRHIDTVAAPARGGSFDLTVETRPGTATAFVLAAALGARVQPVAGLGWLRLDPLSVATVGSGVGAGGPVTLRWTVPADPALAGIPLHHQALLLDPVTGPRLGNAIGDVVQ